MRQRGGGVCVGGGGGGTVQAGGGAGGGALNAADAAPHAAAAPDPPQSTRGPAASGRWSRWDCSYQGTRTTLVGLRACRAVLKGMMWRLSGLAGSTLPPPLSTLPRLLAVRPPGPVHPGRGVVRSNARARDQARAAGHGRLAGLCGAGGGHPAGTGAEPGGRIGCAAIVIATLVLDWCLRSVRLRAAAICCPESTHVRVCLRGGRRSAAPSQEYSVRLVMKELSTRQRESCPLFSRLYTVHQRARWPASGPTSLLALLPFGNSHRGWSKVRWARGRPAGPTGAWTLTSIDLQAARLGFRVLAPGTSCDPGSSRWGTWCAQTPRQ